MGWVTDITFPEGLEQDGTKIRPGMNTQVRWDIGVGSMQIGADGKIKPDSVWHGYPLCLERKETYQKELATWTGYLETNMGVLFFKEGQLQYLDLSYDGIGEWLVNNTDSSWNTKDRHAALYQTLPVERWASLDTLLSGFRNQLLSDEVIDEDAKGGYALSLARKAYLERSGELVDPYYKAPTPNGFIHA